MLKTITVSWFSAGVSSAVATWLVRDKVDKIIYTHIDDQHPDTMRFVKDCETWFGKKIEILQSPLKSVENACRQFAYINGVRGAACTRLLKRRVRQEWESANKFFNNFRYVWGIDCEETKRSNRLCEAMPQEEHIFPLQEKNIMKEEAHGILKKAGIKRPAMYDLGYRNNNCIGCVKGGKGYWNKIRIDFPEVFKKRAETERLINATCLSLDKHKLFLDELDPNAGRDEDPIVEECGAMCELINNF